MSMGQNSLQTIGLFSFTISKLIGSQQYEVMSKHLRLQDLIIKKKQLRRNHKIVNGSPNPNVSQKNLKTRFDLLDMAGKLCSKENVRATK